jgi:N-acetylglucosamine-6-phosphate deacetylase
MVETANAKLTDAVRMASLNGSKVVAREHKVGILSAGRQADMVVLDSNFEVEMTILHGKIAYQKTVTV